MFEEKIVHTEGPWEIEYDWCDCGGDYPCSHGRFPVYIVAPKKRVFPYPKTQPEYNEAARIVDCTEGRDATEADANLIAASPDLLALAKAYEAWEADMILCQEAWKGGMAELPTLTYPLWDRLLELQAMRNAAVAKAEGRKP